MSFAVVHSRALRGLEAPGGDGRGAPGERPAELHPGRPGRHRGEGVARAGPGGVADQRPRVPAQQAGHGEPGARRPAEGVGPLRPADRARHPRRRRRSSTRARLDAFEFAGELSLGGELRPVRGALAMGLAMQRDASALERGRTLVLPLASADETASVGGLTVRGADHLLDVVRALLPGEAADADALREPVPLRRRCRRGACPTCATSRGRRRPSARSRSPPPARHSLLMVGPPGTGKSMLAAAPRPACCRRSAHDEALESAAILSVAGAFVARRWGQRVLRAPHHTASSAALVGGGSPPRPGEVSLAHHGVLFLDELPEFPRAALEALREPLETGRIVVSRAARQAEFPARFQLVAAMNPCPCGQLGNPARRLPLHAGCGAALPGADQRAVARPHRPAGRGAGGRRRAARRRARRRGEQRRSRERVAAARAHRRRPPGGEQRASSPARRSTRTAALDAAALALPAGGDDPARLVGAELSPRAACRPHDRRSRRPRGRSPPPTWPRRSSTGGCCRRPERWHRGSRPRRQ